MCEKPLRPPLTVFPDERHLTDANEPLCETHYQRQCPDCGAWFRADSNPGYFRCAPCAEARLQATPVYEAYENADVGGGTATAVVTAPAAKKRNARAQAREDSQVGVNSGAVSEAKAGAKAGGCGAMLAFGLFAFCGVVCVTHAFVAR